MRIRKRDTGITQCFTSTGIYVLLVFYLFADKWDPFQARAEGRRIHSAGAACVWECSSCSSQVSYNFDGCMKIFTE
jgi:hypothetical protein